MIEYGETATECQAQLLDWLNGSCSEGSLGYELFMLVRLETVSVNRQYTVLEIYTTGNTLWGFAAVYKNEGDATFILWRRGEAVPFGWFHTDEVVLDSDNRIIELPNDVTVHIYTDLDEESEYGHAVFTTNTTYGCTFPVLKIYEGAVTEEHFKGAGVFDFVFKDRLSNTVYSVGVTADSEYAYFRVTNLTRQVLKFELPIYVKYSFPCTIPALDVLNVPKTETSEKFLKKMVEAGTISYKEVT